MTLFPVAVTAMGAVTALGTGADCLFQGLLEGQRAFRPVRGFGLPGCRVTLAAEVTCDVPEVGSSRTAGLAIVAARDALSNFEHRFESNRIGVVLGSAGAGTLVLEQQLRDDSAYEAWLALYAKRHIVDAVADNLGFAGPRHVINTACSSGAVAIAIAIDWLKNNDCDCVLALGSDELGRFTYTGFHSLRAMDPEPCRPFDRNRRGLTMGEGAGCLILERYTDALKRGAKVHGFIRAVGLACDAHHLTAPDPEGVGPARAIEAALSDAQLDASAIGFVNAHGTGTPLNDAAEIASLERGLGVHAVSCPVHSVKATVGHCMGAAGTIEAVVALTSLERGLVPHTAGLEDSEFEGRVRCVKGCPLEVSAQHALSTSFGFGGNDAVIVLSKADARKSVLV
jgi:3-oxoacyl-[acyl-carrier-protein] synthase II